ncbi:MAG: FAD-binding oxidoreductase, partial [Paracoccaceae bacterium]|nr:FAD-binding oxidoreductase [Paracoccaceae bacterium]
MRHRVINPRVIPKHKDSNGWWEILGPAPAVTTLVGPHRVKTAIIGAGICGLSVAHQLGKLCPDDDIALIDAERAGFGASGRNAGFMLNLHSHGPPKKLDILRRNIQLWDSGLADLRRMVREFQIDCDWDDFGRLYGSAGPDGEKHIDE